jgi:transposase
VRVAQRPCGNQTTRQGRKSLLSARFDASHVPRIRPETPKWLRAALTEAAKAASRTRNTYLAAHYQRLRARRGHNKATTAVAHSMLVAAWHILTTGQLYTDPGPDYFTRRDPARTTRRLVAQLERLAYNANLQQTAA